MGIGVTGYALSQHSDGEGFTLERFEPGTDGPTCRRYVSENRLQAALAALDVDSEAGEG